MESISVSKRRIRNRKRKRHGKNKRQDRLKIEFKSAKRQKYIASGSVYVTKDKFIGKSMEAQTFWENYTVAQEWQQRHNVTWWRTRCQALEYENEALREKVRSLAGSKQCHCQCQNETKVENNTEEEEDEPASDEESLEFQVNDDMMDFLKQSIQHKLELKQQRDSENMAAREIEEKEKEKEIPVQGGAAWMRERLECAKLLYGEASPRILGMETALQATTDRHKERANPQYWPNIPLRL